MESQSDAELIDRYERGARELSNLLTGMLESDWDERPIEGTWSIREVLCHLADAEIIYADRMKRVLAEDNPTVFEADPNLHVPALRCAERSWVTELQVVATIRAHMVAILRSLERADFERTCVHSIDGPMTLRTLLQRITSHIPHHGEFIREKREALRSR